MLIALRFLHALGVAAGLVVSRAMARDLFSGNDLVHFVAVPALVFGPALIVAALLGNLSCRQVTIVMENNCNTLLLGQELYRGSQVAGAFMVMFRAGHEVGIIQRTIPK